MRVPRIEVRMNYVLMTVEHFVLSYDRDVLGLHDDPVSYINEVEAELAREHGSSMAFDYDGKPVWPVGVMKAHLEIVGEPQWPLEKLLL
jgi:hypothetical protein